MIDHEGSTLINRLRFPHKRAWQKVHPFCPFCHMKTQYFSPPRIQRLSTILEVESSPTRWGTCWCFTFYVLRFFTFYVFQYSEKHISILNKLPSLRYFVTAPWMDWNMSLKVFASKPSLYKWNPEGWKVKPFNQVTQRVFGKVCLIWDYTISLPF